MIEALNDGTIDMIVSSHDPQDVDTKRLPFADDQFDIAVVVHLFYFIAGWRKAVDELLRVIKPDGPVVLADFVFIDHLFRSLLTRGRSAATLAA